LPDKFYASRPEEQCGLVKTVLKAPDSYRF